MKNKYYVKNHRGKKKAGLRLLGILSIGSGFLILLYFFFPIVSYHFFISSVFANSGAALEVPIPKYTVVTNMSLGSLLSAGFNSVTNDYTDARNWYPTVESSIQTHDVENYFLSIPKIKIEQATVSTNDYDLSKHLVQYYGTTTPPQNGTTVIYGHSTLPQLFDPKNYKTIFANVHKLEINDTIIITIKDARYTYKIFSKNITSPDDVNIFSQNYDNSYITLVTCTPPGTVWKRLIIRAKLEKLTEG